MWRNNHIRTTTHGEAATAPTKRAIVMICLENMVETEKKVRIAKNVVGFWEGPLGRGREQRTFGEELSSDERRDLYSHAQGCTAPELLF